MNTTLHKGDILLADPYLHDPHFNRAVVYITENNIQGTMGFVINNPTENLVCDAIQEMEDIELPLFIGGPVDQDILFYLHSLGDKIEGSVFIDEGIYLGGDFTQVKKLAKSGDLNTSNIKFFLGYSGWGEDQLQDEMKKKSWLIYQAKPTYLFNKSSENLWGKILKDNESKYSVFSRFPDNPSLN